MEFGVRKAAMLMIALRPEKASAVMAMLRPEVVEPISAAVSRMSEVGAKEVQQVLDEANTMLEARKHIFAGGVDVARTLLQKAFGVPKAEEMLRRLRETMIEHPFTFARSLDVSQIWPHLRQESPQTIALVAAFLSSEQAASLLQMLPPEVRGDVGLRLAHFGRERRQVRPEAIEEVASMLRSRVKATEQQDTAVVGGTDAVAAIVTRLPRSAEEDIMEWIRRDDPELHKEISKKTFTFPDLAMLPTKMLQIVMAEISSPENIATALKTATAEEKASIYKALSKDKRDMVEESLSLMDKKPLREVEDAQLKIVAIARRLESEGRISLGRGEGEALV